MNKAKINELYEQAHVVYEIPYEASVVDPTIVLIHKQKVWDRYLFAELIVEECLNLVDQGGEFVSRPKMVERIKEHFGVEEK
jgi:hypothetical protein